MCWGDARAARCSASLMVRDLIGPVQAQLAEMGLLITLEQPTREIEHTAWHSAVFAWPVNHQPRPMVLFPRFGGVVLDSVLPNR